MEKWIAKAVGLMHINKVSVKQLAERIGWSRGYLSEILNGKRNPLGAEARITKAIQEIIEGKGK